MWAARDARLATTASASRRSYVPVLYGPPSASSSHFPAQEKAIPAVFITSPVSSVRPSFVCLREMMSGAAANDACRTISVGARPGTPGAP